MGRRQRKTRSSKRKSNRLRRNHCKRQSNRKKPFKTEWGKEKARPQFLNPLRPQEKNRRRAAQREQIVWFLRPRRPCGWRLQLWVFASRVSMLAVILNMHAFSRVARGLLVVVVVVVEGCGIATA